jgi:hypothetical protein
MKLLQKLVWKWVFILPFFWGYDSHSRELSHLLTEEEYFSKSFKVTLRVDMFNDIWADDPGREMYGGAVRDFHYWLKNLILDNCETREQALALLDKLAETPVIEARLFMHPESDVDTLYLSKPLTKEPRNWGIKKVEISPSGKFNPSDPKYQTEFDQGFLPLEKLRLSRTSGWVVDKNFGDPSSTLYYGDYSTLVQHFPNASTFADTYFARKGINHPILLTLRTLRLLALEEDAVEILENSTELKNELLRWTKDFFEVDSGANSQRFFQNLKFRDFFKAQIEKPWRTTEAPRKLLALWNAVGLSKHLKTCPHLEAGILLTLNEEFHGEREATLFADSNHEQKIVQFSENFAQSGEFIYAADNEDDYAKALTGDHSDPPWLKPRKRDSLPVVFALAHADNYLKNPGQKTKKFLVKVKLKPGTRVVDISKGPGADAWAKFRGGKEAAFAVAANAHVLVVPGTDNQFRALLLDRSRIESTQAYDPSDFAKYVTAAGNLAKHLGAAPSFCATHRFKNLLGRLSGTRTSQ